MMRKEILLHFIAYNCVCRLMYEAVENVGMLVGLVSFKGSLQAIRKWEPQLNHNKLSKTERNKMLNYLYGTVTGLPLQQGPGRR